MKLHLREARKKAGLSQQQLADLLKVHLRTIGNWERGKTEMSLEDAVNCSEALECTPNDLCDWYATHPRENAPALPSDESQLLSDYRACTPVDKLAVARAARNAAALRDAEAATDRGDEEEADGSGAVSA